MKGKIGRSTGYPSPIVQRRSACDWCLSILIIDARNCSLCGPLHYRSFAVSWALTLRGFWLRCPGLMWIASFTQPVYGRHASINKLCFKTVLWPVCSANPKTAEVSVRVYRIFLSCSLILFAHSSPWSPVL